MAVTTCRVCGCTDEQACVWFEVLGDGRSIERRCFWMVDPMTVLPTDLCSECAPDDGGDDAEPLLYDVHGAPLARTGPRSAR